jgi:hypothetical protein
MIRQTHCISEQAPKASGKHLFPPEIRKQLPSLYAQE